MKLKKSVLLLVLVFLVSIAGCTSGQKNSPAPASTSNPGTSSNNTSTGSSDEVLTEIKLPIVSKPVTLKYWVTNNPEFTKNLNDLQSQQELEKKTGVHIEYVHPPYLQEPQAFNLMLASGDLPDMIQEREGVLYYPGGGDKAIADKVYLDLTDYIKKYAPNYRKWTSANDVTRKMTVTDTGKHWGMFHITPDTEPAWTGYAIRKDWLDKLGLKTPVTLDDWHTALTGFKTKLNVEAPLSIYKTGTPVYNHIISAFDIGGVSDVGQNFYQVNGKIKFGPLEPAYKDYVTLMNQWYKEGLIDKDFMSRTDVTSSGTPVNMIATNKTGLMQLNWLNSGSVYVKTGDVKNNPDFFLMGIQAPKKTPDQKIHFKYPSYQVRSGAAITTKCKDVKTAVMWLDYQYSDEGSRIISFGVEGDTYTMKDGKPTFTDKILKPGDGLSSTKALRKYVRWDGPGVLDYRRLHQLPENIANLDTLRTYDKDDADYCLPRVTLTDAESTENANIMPDIVTLVTESTVKFITGVKPLSEYDSFVSQIKNMKIDRAMKIQQDALDRYNARK